MPSFYPNRLKTVSVSCKLILECVCTALKDENSESEIKIW